MPDLVSITYWYLYSYAKSEPNGCKDWGETGNYVELILKLWSIMNVKSPDKGLRKLDKYSEPVKSIDDWKLQFLSDFADYLEKWSTPKYKGYTRQTVEATKLTCRSLVAIAK